MRYYEERNDRLINRHLYLPLPDLYLEERQMITPRENLLRVFSQGEPEWIPLITSVDNWNTPNREGMDPELAEALRDNKPNDDSVTILSRYLGIDIMDRVGPPVRTRQRTIDVEIVTDNFDTVTIWHTPKGDLRHVMRRSESEKLHPPYYVERAIKTAEDLPLFAAVFEDQAYEFNREYAAAITLKRDMIGDDGVLECHFHGTPMGMFYRVYSGVEKLAYLHIDAPEALSDLFSVMERRYQEQLKLAVACDADMFVGIDDTSTTVISPAMFEQYNIHLTNERADICHAAGKRYLHHSCGLLKNLLRLYNMTGMDGVHAFTEPPVGDVTYADGRELLENRIGIRTACPAFLSTVSWDRGAMRESVRETFTCFSPRDRIALGVTSMPFRRVSEMQEVVEECRKYQNRPDPVSVG